MDISQFIERWSNCEGGAERANYVLFLTELANVLDLPKPEPADSHSRYRFEYPVDGDFGQKLRIDLYRENCFILEAKQSRLKTNRFRRYEKPEASVQEDLFGSSGASQSAPRPARWGADMNAAFRQARDYAQRLDPRVDRPPFLITCDVGQTFEFYADFSGQGRAYRPYTHKPTGRRVFELPHLAESETQTFLRQVWTDPRTLDPALERARVTRTIADHLAELSRALELRGHPSQEVALFLGRMLFVLFAKDIGLLPRDRVKRLLRECHESPGSFASQAEALFRAMDVGDFSPALDERLQTFNGGFFRESRAFPLLRDEIAVLMEAAEADWREVEPAIFGTLLEHALDPAERGRLGAHYTPRPYVERLVQATIMEPLLADWDLARAAADARLTDEDADGARLELLAFHEQLIAIRVLDPACGTGNFLYIALEHLHGLEGEVIKARRAFGDDGARDQELTSPDFARGVDPRRFLGLELNPRAAIIAELVLWIGYLQTRYRRDADEAPRLPVLEDYDTINPIAFRQRAGHRSVDAVLDHAGLVVGPGANAYPSPRRPAWPESEFIVGNPPFIGGKDVRADLGDAYAEALWAAHPQMNDSADLVMYWWDHAADLLTRKGTKLRRFGFVTTNSITQVFQRRTVARWLSVKEADRTPLSLVFAVDDHPWTKATRDAAAVRIAMTVAQSGSHEGELASVVRESKLETDQPEVELVSVNGVINADLTVGVDVTRAKPLAANGNLCSPGMKLHGAGFIVSTEVAAGIGLGRADREGIDFHIRPYLNGRDVAGRPRGLLVIDLYGLAAEQVQSRFPEVYQHVALKVKPERDRNNRPTYRENWWVFGEPRAELRPALAGLTRFIVTVETSKHRVFQFLDVSVIPDNKLVTIASDDPALMAVLSSDTHTSWSLRAGGWLGVGNDPVYVKSRCFDPFPFPAWNAQQRLELAKAGEALENFRRARLAEVSGLTLTRLYNAFEAHRAGRLPEQGLPMSMTVEEARDFTAASVMVLAELHVRIDRLTLAAYGWDDLSTVSAVEREQQVLARLVTLNAERKTEEARGEVRWIRPDYQASRSRLKAAGIDDRQDDLETLLAPGGRIAWPPKPRPQLLLIRGALAEAKSPVSAQALASRFKGRKAVDEVPRLLSALERLGQVRRTGDGYTLLRVA